jgi:SNF2 family DNA or RNA helicase
MTIVDPESWDKSYVKFARRYLIRHPLYSSTIIGYNDLPGLELRFKAGAHSVRREDAFGPDDYQFVRRSISLPGPAKILYRKLAKDWVLDTPILSAEHIFKRLVRLQQLASGYLPLDDGTIKEIHTAKIDTVMADLDEIFDAGEKVVLFHKFRWEGNRYEQEIRKLFPHVGVGRIQGGDDPGDRTAAINLIEEGVGPNVILAQTRAGGIGISLRHAKYVGFISSGYSYTERKQAIDRVYMQGEGRCVSDYIVDGTVETAIERAVLGKQNLNDALRNLDLVGRRSLVYGE